MPTFNFLIKDLNITDILYNLYFVTPANLCDQVFSKVVYDAQKSNRIRDEESTRTWEASAICQPFGLIILFSTTWFCNFGKAVEITKLKC